MPKCLDCGNFFRNETPEQKKDKNQLCPECIDEFVDDYEKGGVKLAFRDRTKERKKKAGFEYTSDNKEYQDWVKSLSGDNNE